MEEAPVQPTLEALEAALGYQFENRELLLRALTHPSYCQAGGKGDHNQRLEFLGDAVLGLILAEALYAGLPSKREGVLTRGRSALAKGAHLSALARDLGIAPHLRLSEGEERNAGRERDSILEDALEAIVGAIHLDRGFDTARQVVGRWLGDLQQRLGELLEAHNPKGRLQELVQPRLGNGAIEYFLLGEEGPDHAKQFTIEVRILGDPAGRGTGSSKKEAEEYAAQEALRRFEEA